jgi:Ca-activated chloride channel homolog
MPTVARAAVLALALVLSAAPSLAAQGWILPDLPGDRPGIRPVPAALPVVRLRTDVHVRIAGRVAHVEVEEWFENRGGPMAEGVYHYPLPGETVFDRYSLFQGDLELTGEAMDAEEARRIYEAIVRSQRDPALIELLGQGMIRARVFPFGAGERRRIVLRYTQLLPASGDALEFRYAAGVPSPGNPAFPNASGAAPTALRITVDDAGDFLAPFSPTHALSVERRGGTLEVSPEGDAGGRFALYLPRAGAPVRLSLATHRPASGDGYFMLTLSPGQVTEATMPRDLTVAVDVSGSMSGEKLEQTRRALLQLLGTLGPSDRFRLIRFSSGVESFRPEWSPARGEALAEARQWVQGFHANGGTNIEGALAEALDAASPEGHLPVVVFLTDGLPTVGVRDAELLAGSAEAALGRARVFAFGVGYDVDAYLLDRLASAGRGSVQYVDPGADVEQALGALAMKIRHPVLTDLELDRLPVRVSEIYPRELPDLFAGGELTLFGRYAGPGQGELAVRGQREGTTARFASRVSFPAHQAENAFIPRLWAARKIGELTREVRIGGPDPELVEAIRETALRYGILTEYTSYLVLEPGVVADGMDDQGRFTAEAPRAGREAVLRSAASGAARAASSAADVVSMEALALQALAPGTRNRSESVRLVAGRAFEQVEGRWVDRLHREELSVVEVEPYSAAWFALLDALPELSNWWSEVEEGIVAGRAVSVGVREGGARTLPSGEVARIARDFRAR